MTCTHCGSSNFRKNGVKRGVQIYLCKDCNREFRQGEVNPIKTPFSFKEENNKAEIVTSTKIQITTLGQLIDFCKIDTDTWEIERWVCNKWEVASKINGNMVTVPLYQVKVWLKKKVIELEARHIIEEMIQDAKKYMPKFKTIKYNKINEKYLLEPDIPDLHFGKLAWDEESGDNYDIKIAEDLALQTIQSIIDHTRVYSIDRILFPIGNDYFNVNSKTEKTVHDTPQQEDTRYAKTFVKGRKLAIQMIDMLSNIAPVDVLIIPGNHDEERCFYLGDSLECWYHNSKNVMVDNGAKKRKYYSYGKNLIGLTHGYFEKLGELPLLMATEQPELWSKCIHREWQTGDKHHKKEIYTYLRENEDKGVMVRILRSLSGNDAWHFDKGYVGQTRAGEAFVRHYEKGLISQFLAKI